MKVICVLIGLALGLFGLVGAIATIPEILQSTGADNYTKGQAAGSLLCPLVIMAIGIYIFSLPFKKKKTK